MPDVSSACPKCGAALTAADAEALCPRCLITGLLDQSSDDRPAAGDTAPPFLGAFGDYELLGVIARGGMGTVYRARQISLNRVVALKLIRGGPSAGPAEVRRFRLEAEAAARLEHPNIVPIYEVGEHQGRHFFSMKLVEGGSLAERCEVRGERDEPDEPRAPRTSALLLLKVARAVHFAHQRGVLHRDLKPANILLDSEGEPLVADFGLAKLVNTDSEVTLWGAVLGTPSYMAPEQAEGGAGQATTASDVYSLGAVLYHLLAGRPPFTGKTMLDVLRKVIEEEPVPPSKCEVRGKKGEWTNRFSPRASPLSPDLEVICLKCLEKDPARRYASAEALAQDLERCLRGEPITAAPAGPWLRASKWVRRHPATAALLGVVLCAAAGYVALLQTNERKLTRERDRALLQERRAIAAARRAEDNEAITRTNLYVADVALALRALEEGNLGLARRALLAHTPREDVPDLRGFEWFHAWHRAQGAPAKILRGHTKAVTALAFHRDGQTLVSAGREGQARFWEVVTTSNRLALPPVVTMDPGPAETAALAPVLLASPDALALLAAGATPASLSFRSRTTTLGDVRLVALSPDGNWLAAAGEGMFVRVWHAGRRQIEFVIPMTQARSLTVSPDGRRLWVGSTASSEPRQSAAVRAYDLETHQRVLDLPDVTGVMALSPDGLSAVIVRSNATIEIVDAVTGGFRRAWAVSEKVHSLAWSPDGQTLAGIHRSHEEVALWSATNGRRIGALRPATRIWSIAFSADSRTLASAGADHAVRLWDVATQREQSVLRGHEDEVQAVAFSPDGHWLASGGKDTTVRLWPIRAVDSDTFDAVRWPMAVSMDGRHIISAPPNRPVGIVAISNAPPRFAAASAGELPLAFLPDGNSFVALAHATDAAPPELRFHGIDDAPTRPVVPLPDAPNDWRSGAASPARGVCAVAHDRALISLFDMRSGALLRRLEWPRRESARPFFSADGALLAAFRWPNRFRVWETDTGRLVSEFKTAGGAMQAMTLSLDGRLLATGGDDNMVTVFDTTTGAMMASLRGHKAEVKALAFTPDGRTLASSSTDQTLKLWHASTWREVGTLQRDGLFTFLAFAGEGPTLFAGEYQRGTRRFPAPRTSGP